MNSLDYNALKELGMSVKGREVFRSTAPMYVIDNGDGTYDIKGVFVIRGLTKEKLNKALEELADTITND